MMSALRKEPSKAREVLTISAQLVLGVIVGVAICATWLIFRPVTIMDQAPAAARVATDKHEVLYVRGRPASRSNQGARKQKAFLDRTPGELVFVEEDVNRWLSGAYGSKERTMPIQGIGVTFGPRVPSVRIVGDELEIGLEIGMDREGGSRMIVAQARGRFIERGGRQKFIPRKVYLGSCPLPWNLGGRFVYEKFASLYPIPENVDNAWNAVGHAEVAGNRLRLVVGASAPAPVTVDPAPAAPPAAVNSGPASPAAAPVTTAPETIPAANEPVVAPAPESTSSLPEQAAAAIDAASAPQLDVLDVLDASTVPPAAPEPETAIPSPAP